MSEEELYWYFLNDLELDGLDATSWNMTGSTFRELVEALLTQGKDAIALGKIFEYLQNIFWQEILTARPLFLEFFVMGLLVALVNRFMLIEQYKVTKIGFFAMYASLLSLLLQSFLSVKEIVEKGFLQVCDFMAVLVPAFCASIAFSAHPISAGSFYELFLGMLSVLEWGLGTFLIPAVELSVVLELINYLFEESMFKKLSELLGKGVGVILKIAIGGIFSIGTLENLIGPAKDQIAGNTVAKVITALPGVGNGTKVAEEVILGCGVLVKNCVGVAGMLLLLLMLLIPLLKIAVFALLYQCLLIVLEPISDGKLLACVEATKRGTILFGKLLGAVLLLFFIALAMATAATR